MKLVILIEIHYVLRFGTWINSSSCSSSRKIIACSSISVSSNNLYSRPYILSGKFGYSFKASASHYLSVLLGMSRFHPRPSASVINGQIISCHHVLSPCIWKWEWSNLRSVFKFILISDLYETLAFERFSGETDCLTQWVSLISYKVDSEDVHQGKMFKFLDQMKFNRYYRFLWHVRFFHICPWGDSIFSG